MRVPRQHRIAALALALLAVLAAGCAHAARPAVSAAPSALADCAGKPQVRPAIVDVRCGDNSLIASHLKWSGWGGPVATAIGTAVVNTCEFIDCHTGAYDTIRVVLTVAGALTCPNRSHAYATIQYTFVGHFDAWPPREADKVVPRPCGAVGAYPRDQNHEVPTSSNA
jgi:hypothetical protein